MDSSNATASGSGPHHETRPGDVTTWAWDECHILSVVVTGLYAVVFLLACFQLGRIVYYKHKLMSFQMGFNALLALWMALRFLFFLSLAFPPMPPWANRILFWPATNAQFATYSLLVCFFVSYIYRDRWSAVVRKRAYIAYISINTILTSFTIGWIIAAGNRPESEASTAQILTQILFSAILYLLLSGLLAVYGWMYISKMGTLQAKGKSMGLPAGGTLLQVKIFYVLVLIIFASRYIYAFTAIGVDFSQEPFGIENKCLPSVFEFVALIIWELLPPTLLIIFFRHIPRTGARFSKTLQSPLLRGQSLPTPYAHRYSALFSAPVDEEHTSSDVFATPYLPPGSSVSPDGPVINDALSPWSATPVTSRLLSYESSSSSQSPGPQAGQYSSR